MLQHGLVGQVLTLRLVGREAVGTRRLLWELLGSCLAAIHAGAVGVAAKLPGWLPSDCLWGVRADERVAQQRNGGVMAHLLALLP